MTYCLYRGVRVRRLRCRVPSLYESPRASSDLLRPPPSPFGRSVLTRVFEHAIVGTLSSGPVALDITAMPYTLSERKTLSSAVTASCVTGGKRSFVVPVDPMGTLTRAQPVFIKSRSSSVCSVRVTGDRRLVLLHQHLVLQLPLIFDLTSLFPFPLPRLGSHRTPLLARVPPT